MSKIRYAPELEEKKNNVSLDRLQAARKRRPRSRMVAVRHPVHFGFIFAVALLVFALSLILVQTGIIPAGQTNASPTSMPEPTARIASSTVLANAKVHVYPVVPADAGLMLPAVDGRGNIWFGEMASNRLARLDPETGKTQSWTPPRGEDGIMGTAIDARGNIWFAEQNANYIGRFDPIRQAFRLYPFALSNGHPVGLQDVQFDAAGKLWFTELLNGRIGRLDPANGNVQTWQVPALAGGATPYPFGLTISANGQVWFGTFTGGVIGRLNPASGQITLYHLMHSQEQIYAMTSDAQGRIWFTELQFGTLGMIDPETGNILELSVPAVLGNPEDLHGIVAMPDGTVWFTSSGANALIRYSLSTATFTFFRLSLPDSNPFGLARDRANNLWFTAGGGQQPNYIGEVAAS